MGVKFSDSFCGDFHGERGVHQRDRTDGLEPRAKLLRINVAGNDLQTVIPYGYMSVLSGHREIDWLWMQKWGKKN